MTGETTEYIYHRAYKRGKRRGFVVGMNTAAAFLITLWAIHQLFV
jgi:hypothetical protein